MRFKGTRILLIVFLILGGYVYFTEFRGRQERQKADAFKKQAFQVEQKDVVEISLIYPGRTITGVKKGEKQWQITEPPGVEADSEEWEAVASNLPQIEREETVAENASDLTSFGLQNPPVKIAVKLTDGKTIEILLGSQNPRKTHNYAKLANTNEIFLTPEWSNRVFTKTLTDLRNKKVLEFESDDVDAIKIVEGTKELDLQKSGEDWALKKPIETKADNSEITTFLSSIRFARASSFAEAAVDAKQAGLDPPAIRITLHDAKAKADRVLLIGKSPENDKYYARGVSRDSIMILDKEIQEKARRPVFDWRDKSIAAAQRDNIEEVEIQRGSEKFSFKKADSDWKLSDGRKLQWDKVSGMLNTLEFEKAKDITDSPAALSSYGLDKPKLEVIFRQGSNELLRLAFGRDSKTPEGIYLKTSERPSVQVVSKDVFDKFNVKAEDLIEQKTTSQ